MDHLDEYETYREWAVRTHSGSLEEAVRAEFALAQEGIKTRLISKHWWAYDGPSVAPFALYTRWQEGRVTIATIGGLGSQTGRLTPLCRAFESTGLIVRWENVGNAELRYALRRRGYGSRQQEPCFSTDLIKPYSF